MGRTLIVIGDVHGCYNTLVALIEKCPKGEQFCLVGDLIDRGPRSPRVVDLVLEHGWFCVMGNHEKMALESGIGRSQFKLWMMNGGEATRDSYDADPSYRTEPQKWLDHLRWMASLPSYIEFKDVRRLGRAAPLGFPCRLLTCRQMAALDTAIKEQVANDDVLWRCGERHPRL